MKWEKPLVFELGIESTNNNPIGDNSQNELHWCHKLNGACDTDHNGAVVDKGTKLHTSVNARDHHTDIGLDGTVVNYFKCCCMS